jgi:small subunit ribosomal protein S20
MANHKSADKTHRQSEKHREANRYYSKTMRNSIKKLRENKSKEETTKELPKVISLIDKLAKRNVIHKNKAANLKSSLMKTVKAK